MQSESEPRLLCTVVWVWGGAGWLTEGEQLGAIIVLRMLIHVVYLSKWRSKSDTWLVGMHSLLVRRRTRAKKLTQAPSCLLALLASSAVLPVGLPLVCSCVAPVERLSNSRPVLVQYLSSTCPVLVPVLVRVFLWNLRGNSPARRGEDSKFIQFLK